MPIKIIDTSTPVAVQVTGRGIVWPEDTRYWPEVYIIEDESIGLIKVGWSYIATHRINEIQKVYEGGLEVLYILGFNPKTTWPKEEITKRDGAKLGMYCEYYLHTQLEGSTNPYTTHPVSGPTEWFIKPDNLWDIVRGFLRRNHPYWGILSYL